MNAMCASMSRLDQPENASRSAFMVFIIKMYFIGSVPFFFSIVVRLDGCGLFSTARGNLSAGRHGRSSVLPLMICRTSIGMSVGTPPGPGPADNRAAIS
jgi:hypothetical protein